MAKRAFDLIFALSCLLIAAPLMLAVAILIKLSSRGPALYTPLMVGKDGRCFRLYRFRTMRVAGADPPGPADRLTRVGRFVREYSLDHLPALINVLKGDLSVIGPRPMEPEFVDRGDPGWRAYFSIRPGLLNYAVLKLGRTFGPSAGANMPLKQSLELEYIHRQSLWFDLSLLIRYIWAQIASRGNVKLRGEPDPTLQVPGGRR